jgi:flagellar basal body rod protein FlgC
MTTRPTAISDTAALAAIGAATRDLQLPRLRVEAARLANNRATSGSSPKPYQSRLIIVVNDADNDACKKRNSLGSNASPITTRP